MSTFSKSLTKIAFAISCLVSQVSQSALPMRPNPPELLSVYKFDLLTPTGEKIFRSSLIWESEQIDNLRYPKPAQCANNVSRVMSMSGLPQYGGDSVGELLMSVVNQGGLLVKLTKNKKTILDKLNSIYNGNIPVGSVVGGCLYSNCFSGEIGQRHSAIVADVNDNDDVYLYHNNWYRPANEHGVWKPNMVSKFFLGQGLIRQWMTTPWLHLVRDSSGKIVDFQPLMPKIDDLDPLQYFLSIAVPKEISEEIEAGLGYSPRSLYMGIY